MNKEVGTDMEGERKPGTVLRDIRRHYLLATQLDLAIAAELSKRTVNRVEYREAVRERTQLAIVRGLDKLLSSAHSTPIRLAVTDIFGPDDRAVEGIDRDLEPDERTRLRNEFVTRLLAKRIVRAPVEGNV